MFGCDSDELDAAAAPNVGRFVYAGPTILESHGEFSEGLASNCLDGLLMQMRCSLGLTV